LLNLLFKIVIAGTLTRTIENYSLEVRSRLALYGPGFSPANLHDGVVVLEMHHGLASLELGVPLDGGSAYYLASDAAPL